MGHFQTAEFWGIRHLDHCGLCVDCDRVFRTTRWFSLSMRVYQYVNSLNVFKFYFKNTFCLLRSEQIFWQPNLKFPLGDGNFLDEMKVHKIIQWSPHDTTKFAIGSTDLRLYDISIEVRMKRIIENKGKSTNNSKYKVQSRLFPIWKCNWYTRKD